MRWGEQRRNEARQRTRQPLSRLLIRAPDAQSTNAAHRHREHILEELNVKALEIIAQDAELVSYRIKPNLPRIGKRHGKLIPKIREALNTADKAAIAAAVTANERYELTVGDQVLTFEAEDLLVETTAVQGYASAEEGGYLVGLDLRLTPELVREGLARELSRTANEARKQAGLEVSDRLILRIIGSEGVEAALSEYRDYLTNEILVLRWGGEDFTPTFTSSEYSLDEHSWRIAFSRA